MVDEVLHDSAVAACGLAAGAAVDPDEGRRLGARGGLVRLVEDVRNHHAVERLEAHHLRVDEVRRVDVLLSES